MVELRFQTVQLAMKIGECRTIYKRMQKQSSLERRNEPQMRFFVCFLLSKILIESNTKVGISVPAVQFICYENRTGALHLFHFILHEHHLYCVHRTEKHYFTNQTMTLSNYPDFCLFKYSDVSYSSTSLIYFVAGCIHTHTHTDVAVNCAPQI